MKNLYKQFDKLRVDTELQPMDVSELEKARIKKRVVQGRKKKNPMLRNLSVAAALFIASSITFSIAFPTLAAKLPIVGSLYEQFEDDSDYVFENYDSFSTEIGLTKESNGIRVTVTEAVYDKESVTIAYTIEGEQNFGTKPILEGNFHAKEFGNSYEHSGFYPKHITKKISDTEYAGLFIYQLIDGPKPDEIHATWTGSSILDVLNTNNQFSGDWTFNLTLQALEEETTKSFAHTGTATSEDGVQIALTKMTKTPISTTLYLTEHVDVPVTTSESEEFRVVVFDYEVKDNLGNQYNAIHFMDVGHSSNFKNAITSKPRLTMTHFHEDASSITITPYVNIYTFANKEDVNEGPLELVKQPYAIKPLQFSLE